MTTQSSSFGIINSNDSRLHHIVGSILRCIEVYCAMNTKIFIRMNSHVLTRAIAHHVPELKVVDGEFAGINLEDNTDVVKCFTDHSWLITPDGVIIEVYPVGSRIPAAVMIPTNGIWTAVGGGHFVHNEISAKKIQQKLATRTVYRQILVLEKIISLNHHNR